MGGQGVAFAGFSAEPESVARLGKLVGRAGEDAQSYLDRALPEPADLLGQIVAEVREGVLFNIWPALDRWQELGRRNTERGAVLATMGGAGLEQAAEHYRQTDFFNAQHLDASYGFGGSYTRLSGEGRPQRGPDGAFTDIVDPGEYRPGDPSEQELEKELLYLGEELAGQAEKVMGFASMYGQWRAFIRDILGYDPIEEALRLVTGDWRVLAQQGRGFAATAGAFDAIRENIDQGRFEIQDRWTGIAASRAQSWLADYSTACGQHAEFMRQASEEIRHFARGTYHRLVALNGALDTAVDMAIEAALMAPGLSAVVGGGIALFRGENPLAVFGAMIAAFTKVGEIIGQIMMAAHAFVGLAETIAGAGEAATATWPAMPYDHPSCG